MINASDAEAMDAAVRRHMEVAHQMTVTFTETEYKKRISDMEEANAAALKQLRDHYTESDKQLRQAASQCAAQFRLLVTLGPGHALTETDIATMTSMAQQLSEVATVSGT